MSYVTLCYVMLYHTLINMCIYIYILYIGYQHVSQALGFTLCVITAKPAKAASKLVRHLGEAQDGEKAEATIMYIMV